MVPLLKKLPDAQNESLVMFIGVAMCFSRFHKAPQAVWLSIWRGSLVALSNIMIKVGETTIASSARIPEVPFCRKCQPALAATAA